MAIRVTARRHRTPGASGDGAPGPAVPGDEQRAHHPDFGVHWILTALLLGAAGWTVLGALVAAAFGSWVLAGWLMVGCAVFVGTLLLLAASSRRIRRARAARPLPAPTVTPEPAPANQRHLTVLPRPDQVA